MSKEILKINPVYKLYLRKIQFISVVFIFSSCIVLGEQSIKRVVASTAVVEDIYEPVVIYQGKWGSGYGEFGVDEDFGAIGPYWLTSDAKGNIYVLDGVNNRIYKFNPDGKILSIINLEREKGAPGICLRRTAWVNMMGDRLDIGPDDNFYITAHEGTGRGFVVLVYDKKGKFIKNLSDELGRINELRVDFVDKNHNIYLVTDDTAVANIPMEEEIKGKLYRWKAAYYLVTSTGIIKLDYKPVYEYPKPKGKISYGVYERFEKETWLGMEFYIGDRREYLIPHVTYKGEVYGIYWNFYNEKEGVKLLKWVKKR